MDPKLLNIIRKLLQYNFEPIGWDFFDLTDTEKTIIGDQETLDALRTLAEKD